MLYAPEFQSLKERLKFFQVHSQEPRSGLICSICKDILVKPHQSLCGCRFCYNCVQNQSEKCQKYCPGCNDVIESIGKNIIYDKAIEKELFGLQMKCINDNCNKIFKLINLVDHLKDCEQRREKCDSCHDLYLYIKAEEHKTTKCKMIKINCDDCGTEMTMKYFEDVHKNSTNDANLVCSKWKGICPNNCSTVEYENIKIHLQDCPLSIVECTMKPIGCNVKLARIKMADHFSTDITHHSCLMIQTVNQLKTENVSLKSNYLKRNDKLNSEFDELKQTFMETSLKINNLEKIIKQCDSKNLILQNESNILKQSLTFSLRSKTDLQHLASSSLSSTFGQFEWTIDEMLDKINDAKRGINVYLLSDSFYTGKPGYNVSLKIYPNGDGNGRGKYVSLYFVVTKGKYDDAVSWPFCKKVSLSLLSNGVGVSDITVNMKPDINESCYGRPKELYNVASGHPQFMSHVDLMDRSEFRRNNTVKFRIVIDS